MKAAKTELEVVDEVKAEMKAEDEEETEVKDEVDRIPPTATKGRRGAK